jgi:hypothetical protein
MSLGFNEFRMSTPGVAEAGLMLVTRATIEPSPDNTW